MIRLIVHLTTYIDLKRYFSYTWTQSTGVTGFIIREDNRVKSLLTVGVCVLNILLRLQFIVNFFFPSCR